MAGVRGSPRSTEAGAEEPTACGRGLAGVDARELLEAIADGVVVFDARGDVVHRNSTAEEIWHRAGVVLGGPAGRALPRFELRGEDGRPLPGAAWPVARALSGERVQGLHLCFAAEGARPVWMLASAAPIRDGGGAVTGAVLSFSDESQARELAEARDDLVRMVSHDLRTPLSAIYGQAHLIRRGGEPPERTPQRAGAIERSCERMSGMIQDLVEVTLLEAGQLPVVRAVVNVAALVPDMLDGLRGGIDVDRIRLDIEAPCWANVDPGGLERIVVNLVTNALKYSADEVRLALRREGEAVVLQVADRGVGVSPEDRARVFERYFRAIGTRRPEGLGLGLYITRLLVEAQGGHIELESELGKGSTFRVVLAGAAAGPGEAG